MKKRFLSLLTAFMLAFALAVPVGAISHNGNEIDISSIWEDRDTYPYAVVGVYNGTYWIGMSAVKPTYYANTHVYTESGMAQLARSSDGKTWVKDGGASSRGWMDIGTPIWTNSVIYTSADMNQVYLDAPSCDGSVCPATDENIDGICDDCGMMLMSLSRSPVAPDVTGSNKNYVMFYSGTVYKYTVYTSDESYTIRGEEYGARYRTYTDPSVTVQRYESYDGINWEQTYSGKTANDYPGEIGYELISSTFDWYTEAGDRFFPVPLWEEVQTVTQGEMGTLTSGTAGTMKTLVVCGVGLMACLMALSLFGKRWLLFLR